MKEAIKNIIEEWKECEITGDKAMKQVEKIFNEDMEDKDETINAYFKEK